MKLSLLFKWGLWLVGKVYALWNKEFVHVEIKQYGRNQTIFDFIRDPL